MQRSSTSHVSTANMTQESQGQKRKERDEDDMGAQFYANIDPRLLDDVAATNIVLSNISPKISHTSSPLFIPGLHLSGASSNKITQKSPKRVKLDHPKRLPTIMPGGKGYRATNTTRHWSKAYAGAPSKHLETQRNDVAWKVASSGGNPPPLPSIIQHTYKVSGYAHLRPALEELLKSPNFQNALDGASSIQDEQRRKEEKKRLSDERNESITKYELVVESLERRFTFERRMRNAGVEKVFVRATASLQRISKTFKARKAMIKRGKSSGLRTCWSFRMSKPTREEIEGMKEDEFDEALEEGLDEAYNWAYQERISELQADRGDHLRKQVARHLECLYRWT
jgi:hypothetical protein